MPSLGPQQSIYGDVPFTLNAFTATLKVTVTAHQTYSGITGNDPWQLTVYIDGSVIGVTGGSGVATETPILVAIAKNLSAGNHTLKVTWAGSQYINFVNDVTAVESNYK